MRRPRIERDVARPMHKEICYLEAGFREMGADVARPMRKQICCSEAGLPRMRLVRRPWRDGSGCCEAHAEMFDPRWPVFPHGEEIFGGRRGRTRKKLLAAGEAYKVIF